MSEPDKEALEAAINIDGATFDTLSPAENRKLASAIITAAYKLRLDAAEAENTRLEQEIAFWAGEGQNKRPEMIEWHKLAQKKNRTPKEQSRIRQINEQIRIENENEPELRMRIKALQAALKLQEAPDA